MRLVVREETIVGKQTDLKLSDAVKVPGLDLIHSANLKNEFRSLVVQVIPWDGHPKRLKVALELRYLWPIQKECNAQPTWNLLTMMFGIFLTPACFIICCNNCWSWLSWQQKDQPNPLRHASTASAHLSSFNLICAPGQYNILN